MPSLSLPENSKKDNNNLWLKFLEESSQNNRNNSSATECNCIVFGDKNSKKETVIQQLTNQEPSNVQIGDNNTISLIDYYHGEIVNDNNQTSKIHYWSIDERLAGNGFDILSKSLHSNPMCVLIVVDLTAPMESIQSSLRKWLSYSAHYIQRYAEGFKEDITIVKEKFQNYILHARSYKSSTGNTSSASSNTSSKNVFLGDDNELSAYARYELAIDKYFVPVVIVGTNFEQIDLSNLLTLKTIRELQGRIRCLALEAGATVVFTSTMVSNTTIMSTNTSSKTSNTVSTNDNDQQHLQQQYQLLKKYLYHRVYPDAITFPMDVTLEGDRLEATFIPSGFDTVDLIQIATTQKPSRDELKNFISNFKLPSTSTTSTATNTATSSSKDYKDSSSIANIESEQDWLQGLYSFIAKVADAEGGGKSSSNSNALSVNLNDMLDDDSASTTNNTTTSERSSRMSMIGGKGLTSASLTASLLDQDDNNNTSTTSASITSSGPVTRRTSILKSKPVVTNAASNSTDKKEVNDFFQNLLAGKK